MKNSYIWPKNNNTWLKLRCVTVQKIKLAVWIFFAMAAGAWAHDVDGNPPRPPWNTGAGQDGWNPPQFIQFCHHPYHLCLCSSSSLLNCVWNIPFPQRQCVCVLWKVSWFWVTWSWSAQNLWETSSWLLHKDKQSVSRAPRVRFACHDVDRARKVKRSDSYFAP